MRVSRAEVFSDIYAANRWNGTETPSGPGSTMAATALLRERLPVLIGELGGRHVLDAGCGTGYWMPELPGYIGVDVAGVALAAARRAHPERRYLAADICADPLPASDIVICRDALQHLSLADGLAAVANFRAAGASWLITTTHADQANRDITTGDWYAINVEAPPFDMGTAYVKFPDGVWDNGVWRIDKFIGAWPLL